jgi:hypothetical protein
VLENVSFSCLTDEENQSFHFLGTGDMDEVISHATLSTYTLMAPQIIPRRPRKYH